MQTPSVPSQLATHNHLTRGFRPFIRWMGRLISTYVVYQISELDRKVQQIAIAIIHLFFSSPAVPASNDDIFEGEENLQPIVDSLFEQMGCTPKEALENALIFNLDHVKQENIDLTSLRGEYQVEFTEAAQYRGHFDKGLFHGEGTFFKKEPDETLHIILKGQFHNGAFVSGIMTMDDSYIHGTFINGKKQGTGVIRYLEGVKDQDGNTVHREYHGEFYQGKPHGKGTLLLIHPNGVRWIGEGEFKEGVPLKGRFQENDNIFEGEWREGIFKGTITNSKERWKYEGTYQNKKFEGQGKLSKKENYEYEDIEEVKGEFVLVKKRGSVTCLSEGKFSQGHFHEGQQKIHWDNGQTGISYFEKGKNGKSTITMSEGLTYIGNFHSYTLDGVGTIYNEQGEEIYTGGIKSGSPHDQGRRKLNNIIEEGKFERGKFKGP